MESIAPADGPYVVFEGKKFLDFSSCDFLGLAKHPDVKKGAIRYTLKYGTGTPPSSMRSTPQIEVETKLAHYLGKEAALLFPSASEMYTQLEKLGAALFSTETDDISAVKKSKGPKVADETFLIGLSGSNGFGSSSDADAVCGFFSCGPCAFIAGSKKFISSFNPGALGFPALGAIDCALMFIPEMDAERKIVQKHKAWLIKQLGDLKLIELRSPRVMISSEETKAIRQFFLQEQIYLSYSKDSTLYFSMTALHTPDDLDQLATSLKKLSTTDLALVMQSLTLTP